jgi:hypothetical protein
MILKTEENKAWMRESVAAGEGKVTFAFLIAPPEPRPKLFGTVIETGPAIVRGEGEVKNLSEAVQAFEQAATETEIEISVKPLGPLRLSLQSAEKE